MLHELHRHHGLRRPVVEHKVDGGRYRLDFAWPDLRLAVEVDGWGWHGPDAKEHDAARRTELAAAGWIVLVFTWRQIVDEPATFSERVLAAYRRAEAAAA